MQKTVPSSDEHCEVDVKKLPVVVSGFLLLAIFIWAAIWWVTLGTQKAAEALLGDVRHLRAGESTFSDARNFSSKYARYLSVDSSSCSQMSCNFSFSFDNRWLHNIRFTAYTLFTCQIVVTSDRVTWMELMMATDAGSRVFIEQFPSAGRLAPYKSGGKMTTSAPWHAILIDVQFTPDASTSLKENALAFNLPCLTKLGGCRYSEEMLPQVHLAGGASLKQ